MNPTAYIECVAIDSVQPAYRSGIHAIAVELRMTDAQRKSAILDMLGDLPEQAACEWFKSAMPDWFKVSA